MIVLPAIVAGIHTLRSIQETASLVVEVPRKEVSSGCGESRCDRLLPDRLAIIDLDIWVGEPSDTSHCTEVVIEGSIFYEVLVAYSWHHI